MVFNILIIVATGLVAFFHYIQGLFNATISAVLIAFAAVIAFNYYEPLAQLLIGKLPDYSASLCLVVLFAASYVILRLIFDRVVPGNVRYPVLMDRIGAGVVGFVAGLIATGVVAVAAQALPFGPTIGLYGRYAVADKSGSYFANGQAQDVKMLDVVSADYFDHAQETPLIFQQDDLVVGMIRHLSDNGSLAGNQPMAVIHPDYLTELFGQRIGIQVGAKHSLVNSEKLPQLKVTGVYTQDQLTQVDGDSPDLHLRDQTPALVLRYDKESGQSLLIVRVSFSNLKDVSDDSDGMFRFSPGSVRLTTGHLTSHGAEYKDYYPIALLDPRGVAVACRIDDYLIMPAAGGRVIDFIFGVDNSYAYGSDMPPLPPYNLAPDSFLTIKRYGFFDLSNFRVTYGPPPNQDRIGVFRPGSVTQLINQTEVLTLVEPPGIDAPGAPTKSGSDMGNTGLRYIGLNVSNRLSDPVDVHGGNQPSGDVQLASVRGDYVNRQWQHLRALVELNNPLAPPPEATTDPTSMPAALPDNIDQVAADPHWYVLQLHCRPILDANPRADQAWAWLKGLSDITLIDRNGHTYTLAGLWARSKITINSHHHHAAQMDLLNVSYGNDSTVDIPQMGIPTDVYIAFRVPADTVIREVRVNGTTVVENLSVTAK